MQDNDNRQYQINISGNRFTISSPYGEEHVREVEKFLDRQIKEVSEQTEAFGPSSIAMLVALNLADKLLALQKRVSKFDGLEEDLDTLCFRLDKVLANNDAEK
ncbi:MAG: cell division protein ZapA [SAR324 cluster bacterium]|nr:cell division protein ZapA [SAR324 cluster bacterium]MBL7034954.1 cell division protein ZapA [SAR324 cluster bacterium]